MLMRSDLRGKSLYALEIIVICLSGPPLSPHYNMGGITNFTRCTA
jgi:hypothetical protein